MTTHTEGKELSISPIQLICIAICPRDMNDADIHLKGRNETKWSGYQVGGDIHPGSLEVCSPPQTLLLCNCPQS